MKVCASSLEAHKSAFQEARELRGKVKSQEQSVQSLVRRTLRLAAQLHLLQVCFFVRCNCTNSAPNLQQLMRKNARRAQVSSIYPYCHAQMVGLPGNQQVISAT